MFPKVSQTFFSAKTIVLEMGVDNHNMYPTRYLNSLKISRLSPSKLQQKVGCPIVLLYNIASKHGLCNGSRLIVIHLNNHIIEALILTKSHARETIFISKITLQTTKIPFKFSSNNFLGNWLLPRQLANLKINL